MSWDTFWLLAGFGLMTGSLTALGAMGFSLMMSVTGVVNFAYGEYMTLAAYIGVALATTVAVPLVAAVPIAVGIVAALGPLTDRIVFRPISKRGELTILVTSIGLSLVLQNAILAIWGTDIRRFDLPSGLSQSVSVGPFRFTELQLGVIGLSLVLMLALAPFLKRTATGRSMRAMADNVDLARASGVAVKRVRAITWAIACGLAAIAGLLLGMTSQLNPGMGFAQLLVVVAAVILGGFGNLVGAVVAAYALGIAMEVSTGYIDASLKPVVAFGALVLVLLIRPQGIFMRAAR
jgi:branched-chain amino acid transport system permease protein